MPRLHSFFEYRFVQPGWKHPLGYKVEHPTDASGQLLSLDVVDAIAARQAEMARRFELQAVTCDHHECERRDAVWSCMRRLASARECTRTPERTVLIKVTIPVDNS